MTSNKTKAIIFDVTGMLSTIPHRFSIELQKKQNVPIEDINQFFDTDFKSCLSGEADLKDILPPYMDKWGWDKSVDELLKLWFNHEDCPNEKLLSWVKEMQKKGISCYVASNQEKHHAHYIAENMGFLKLFDHCFFSFEAHSFKPKTEFFEYVWDGIQYLDNVEDKKQVMFWDDQQFKVEAGLEFGFDSYLFVENDQFIQTLNDRHIL